MIKNKSCYKIFTIIGIINLSFFFSLQREDLFGTSVVHVGQPERVRLAMQKKDIPFTLSLFKLNTGEYNGN